MPGHLDKVLGNTIKEREKKVCVPLSVLGQPKPGGRLYIFFTGESRAPLTPPQSSLSSKDVFFFN